MNNNNFKEKIDDLIANGYDFRFGEYISQGFNIFGKYVGGFIGFIIIYIVITSFLGVIPLLGQLISMVVAPPLIMGIYIVAHKIQNEEKPEFGDFFKGFDHFGQLVMTNLVMYLLILLACIPFMAAVFSSGIMQAVMSEDPAEILDASSNFPVWSVVLLLPVFYLTFAYAWSNMFVVFFNVDFWTALEASRKVVTKKWLIIFLFLVVTTFIAMLGVVGFVIGIIVTVPVAMIAIYVAFADVTDLNREQEEGDELLDHLIDTV